MKYQEDESKNAKSQITNQANNTLFFQAEELQWNILLAKKFYQCTRM